ncbi:hypothetical protein [Limnohabitans sp. JirII-31]|uniref:hypothetical protein n=1 Tax=Limnohabitans sp. JirII-31 TaxID=1977908 RepID=UPI00117BB340|nr:hypothetical protein [Limnohabitans sp. JirII-31]
MTFNGSLKYLMLCDPSISVVITGASSFEIYESSLGMIVPNGPAISQARLSDFLLGVTRVRKQYEDVLRLKACGASAAWLLVSTYYCAYFACVELGKIMNRIPMSLEDSDLYSLACKAVGTDHAAFFAAKHTNFVGSEHAGKLIFRSIGTKPHQAAWENALYVLRQVLGGKGWTDANYYIDLLENAELSPSRIRNTWNYRRPDYFGNSGERQASEFKKLVGNSPGATEWLKRTKGLVAPLDPCIVAVFCEALASAISDAGHRAGELVRQAGDK